MDQQHPIDRLYQRIGSRQNSDAGSSYTASLLAKGTLDIALQCRLIASADPKHVRAFEPFSIDFID